ncbi:MAG: N-methyl-D-aspartate receptor subunit [Moraxellaceae bacterium]|jgi:predicted metal-dependent HD superfamily phosphohydrolase|nr:N-methyl-D-aspartate receptor subunit [Moraxellaceae bacterium]
MRLALANSDVKQRQDLLVRWEALWQENAAAPPSSTIAKLVAAWSEPNRHYHTLQHLGECLANFETLRHLPEHPLDVQLALWFHDAIYDVTRHDNEARSAEWARQEILAAGLSAATADSVATLIMATCHNAEPVGVDAEVLVDIDLWILGAPPDRFEEYERQVRKEYAHVPDEAFRLGRLAILQQFQARPRLFNTEPFFTRYEPQARSNLQHSITKLLSSKVT